MAAGKTSHSGAHAGARVDITKANKARRAKKRAKIAASPKTKARAEARKARAHAKRMANALKPRKEEPIVKQHPGAIINELGEQVGLVE